MKFMNMKRFGAAVMAGTMALSLAVPAFAEGEEGGDTPSTTTTITSEYKAVELKVTVPNTGSAIINPYGLPYDLTHEEAQEGGETEKVVDASIIGEQITTGAPLVISNQGSTALAVSAEVIGAPDSSGAVVLIEDASKVDTAETTGADEGSVLKNVAAKFEAFAAPGIVSVEGEFDESELNEAFAALKSEDAALTAPVLEADEDGNGKTTTGNLVLREGEDGFDQDGSVAFIRLSGKVAKNPTAAWAATDKFTATIAFSFEPSEYVAPVELKASVDSIAMGGTAKVTMTTTLPTVGQTATTVKYDTIKWSSNKTTYATVVDSTKKPTAPATTVAGNTLTGTVTGVKNGSAVITVEFEGSDGITYRGSTTVTITK